MKLHLALFLVLSFGFLYGKDPDWVDFDQRKSLFPDSQYFTGFSMREVDKSEDQGEVIEMLKKEAISHLANSIQVTVQSVSTLNTLELDKQVYQEFREDLSSFSRVDLSGITTESFYDQRHKKAYAVAYVKKSKLIDHYNKLIGEKADRIAQQIKIAENYLQAGDRAGALKAYFECMPLFTGVDQAAGIVMLLGASRSGLEQVRDYEVQVKQAVSELYQSELLTLNDVCGFMAYGLAEQAGDLDGTVRLANFTFEDTRMSSPLARRLISTLENELIAVAGYRVSDAADDFGDNPVVPAYLIKGTYWDEGDHLKITAILRAADEGTPLATAEGLLPKKWIRETGVLWKPENFAQAQSSLMQFLENEVTDQSLGLDVWTNHGSDSPVFEDGDTLQFYVRVSAPAYVRIINHFADGSRVLLVDNLFIGSDKVNKVVRIGDQFVCAAPFGAEILQVNAQTEPFPPLITEQEWGYVFIKNKLEDIIKNSRGFKPVKNEDMKAEKRIVVTTMAG